MSFLGPRSQWRQRGLLDTILRMGWAVGFVLVIGAIGQRLSVRPSGALMAYAIAVLLAALLNGTPGAIAAIVTAAVMGALVLPPSNSLYINPPFRVVYVLFLVLCILISFYRPPRNTMPSKRYDDTEKRSVEPYTEANLPTVVHSEEETALRHRRVIEGVDIYQWERACAHLSDLIWDAQVKLQENDSKQAYVLLQHAYEVAAQTRQHIRDVDLLPSGSVPSGSVPSGSVPSGSARTASPEAETVPAKTIQEEPYRNNEISRHPKDRLESCPAETADA